MSHGPHRPAKAILNFKSNSILFVRILFLFPEGSSLVTDVKLKETAGGRLWRYSEMVAFNLS